MHSKVHINKCKPFHMNSRFTIWPNVVDLLFYWKMFLQCERNRKRKWWINDRNDRRFKTRDTIQNSLTQMFLSVWNSEECRTGCIIIIIVMNAYVSHIAHILSTSNFVFMHSDRIQSLKMRQFLRKQKKIHNSIVDKCILW